MEEKTNVALLEKMDRALNSIERAIAWYRKNLPSNRQKQAMLADCRKSLKRKRKALSSKAAIAIFGESQSGKSYLVNIFLSEPGKPFAIAGHIFLNINSLGQGTECTSIVTRFSISEKWVNAKFPVKVKLLSVSSIILMLCDSFYNDIVHDSVLSVDDLNAMIDGLSERYAHGGEVQQAVSEDDLLEMQEYFTAFFGIKAANVLASRFFEVIPPLVARVRYDEWPEVFSLLWNNHAVFTTLFDNLIKKYSELGFANKTLYLPIEAVLYEHEQGGLLDIHTLNKIYETTATATKTSILLFKNGKETLLQEFPIPWLSALSEEVVFCLPEELTERKGYLTSSDILDFPGARARLGLPACHIQETIMPDLLIRGKVGFLFNKYSMAEQINLLLVCCKHEQSAQRAMPEILDRWVRNTVGQNPAARKAFMEKSKVAPLFLIGTFFNENLELLNIDKEKVSENENEISSLDYRWKQRFHLTLENELINVKSYSWFTNWTDNVPFKNIYLLPEDMRFCR